jgi:hypothetical protein
MGTGKAHTAFWWWIPEGKNHLEYLGVERRIIFKWIFKKLVEDMDWIDLPQYRDRWRALVNAVMNFRVP